ncbi:MAG: hypothetical protein EOP06_16105 [Proteobacteria bacterium]|nr:MAG: hypothetical protein EOP06_16105 [Pseudomonadota bacterium]
MKIHWLAGATLALAPACALAQTPTPSSAKKPAFEAQIVSIEIDPIAETLLDRATATYKNARGLSLKAANTRDGQDIGQSRLRFTRPNLIAFERQLNEDKEQFRLLLTGKDLYVIQGTSYAKVPKPARSVSQIISSADPASGQLLGAMLEGLKLPDLIVSTYPFSSYQDVKSKVIALAPRVIDGQTLSGIRITTSFGLKSVAFETNGRVRPYTQELTAWFGGTPFLLCRTQMRTGPKNGKVLTFGERLLDQELNLTFPADTFKFNSTGLKPMPGGLLGAGTSKQKASR